MFHGAPMLAVKAASRLMDMVFLVRRKETWKRWLSKFIYLDTLGEIDSM